MIIVGPTSILRSIPFHDSHRLDNSIVSFSVGNRVRKVIPKAGSVRSIVPILKHHVYPMPKYTTTVMYLFQQVILPQNLEFHRERMASTTEKSMIPKKHVSRFQEYTHNA